MPRRPALPSLLALLLAAPLAAQPPGAASRPPSDSVPRELVLALLQGSDGLRVGEPAGDLPRALLPPNGIVLGSVEYTGTSTTLVVTMQPEHEAIAAHEERARAAGWTPPSPAAMGTPYGEAGLRGFVPSGYGARGMVAVGPGAMYGMGRGTTPTTTSAPLCNGNAMLVASSSPWSGGRTLLRLQSMSAADYSPCRPRMPEGRPETLVRHVTVYDSIIPTLQPPSRAQVQPSGSSSGMSEWGVQVRIETAMSVADLLAHYAGEMAREGWTTVGAAAVAEAAAVQQWRKVDARGRAWHATIAMTGRPDGRRYRGELRLEREDAR